MKNKWTVLVSALLIALTLSGCQLAMEEKEATPDRFVGLSVRLTDTSDFDRSEPHEVDGQRLIVPMETNEQGETMILSDSGEWFSDVHLSLHTRDSGEERRFEGTLYVCPELIPSGVLLKAEEVYQRPDGSLYAVNGGHNYSGHLGGLKIEIDQSRTVTDSEGNETTDSCIVTLRVEEEAHVLSAELIEMDAANQEIARHALESQEEIRLSPQAEWALLTENLADGSARRTALNRPFNETYNETYIEIRRPNEQGVCAPVSYRLLSGDAQEAASAPRGA